MRTSLTPLPLFMSLIATAAVMFVIPPRGWAQDTTRVAERRAALRVIEIGKRLRIEAPSGRRLEGVLAATRPDGLVVGQDAQTIQLDLGEIDRLWVRGRSTKQGALIGGITGAVAGIGYGLLVGEGICNNEDCNADTAAVVGAAGLLGAASGALAGAAIGALIPRWHRRL